jgi:hypothetical protein
MVGKAQGKKTKGDGLAGYAEEIGKSRQLLTQWVDAAKVHQDLDSKMSCYLNEKTPFIYCYVTNQTVLTCPCSHEARYSYLYILILYRPCERSVMIPPYPLVFLRLLIYSTVASSELTGIASTVLLVSSVALGSSVNSPFE